MPAVGRGRPPRFVSQWNPWSALLAAGKTRLEATHGSGFVAARQQVVETTDGGEPQSGFTPSRCSGSAVVGPFAVFQENVR